MTLLERLKEFNAGNVWDFNDLGLLVKALPALIEVAEAADEVTKDMNGKNLHHLNEALKWLEAEV